jgi:hypothetical protein
MADTRDCEQCGTGFEPRREHARFCSAQCRVAWNRERADGAVTGDAALGWSVTAMTDGEQRLRLAQSRDLPQAIAVVSEAVWWVTIVDATMVRYHVAAYDRSLAGLDPDARRVMEGTFGGLRFVRNQMGYHADPADFIAPQDGDGTGDAPVAAWTWNQVPAPALRPARELGKAWEMSRYRDYRSQLAGRRIGDSIGHAAGFLTHVFAAARPAGPATAPGARRAGAL